jgi:hypothetical protein
MKDIWKHKCFIKIGGLGKIASCTGCNWEINVPHGYTDEEIMELFNLHLKFDRPLVSAIIGFDIICKNIPKGRETVRINEEMKDWTSGRNRKLCNKFNRIFKRGVAQLGSALGSGNSGLRIRLSTRILQNQLVERFFMVSWI